MGWTPTLAILAIAAAVGAVARWQLARKRPLGEVSLIPWTQVMMVAVVIVLLMIVHAVNMLGVDTGRVGRSSLR